MVDIPAIKWRLGVLDGFPGASWSWLAWKAPMTARRTAPFWPPNGCFLGKMPLAKTLCYECSKEVGWKTWNWNMISKGTILIAKEVGTKMVVVISLAGFHLGGLCYFLCFWGLHLLYIKLCLETRSIVSCETNLLLVVHPILSLIGPWVATYGKQGSRSLTRSHLASYSLSILFCFLPSSLIPSSFLTPHPAQVIWTTTGWI